MKLFKKSKEFVERVKKNGIVFINSFKAIQQRYFELLVKKNKTKEERIEFRKLKCENFKLSVFILFWLAPVPLIGMLYFIIIPKFLWPETIKVSLNDKRNSITLEPRSSEF